MQRPPPPSLLSAAAAASRSRRNPSSADHLFSCNLKLAACARTGDLSYARQIFDEMPRRNSISFTAIIDAHMKHRSPQEAMNYFQTCPFHLRNNSVVLWTAAINGLSINGLYHESMWLFKRMLLFKETIFPNEATLTSIIKACIASSEFDFAGGIIGLIIKTGFLENYLTVRNSLITLHLKTGELLTAKKMFNEMQQKDVVSWTAILDVFFKMGDFEEVHKLFNEMPERNEVSWSTMIARFAQNGEFLGSMRFFVGMIFQGLRPNVSCYASVLSAVAELENLDFGTCVHCSAIKAGFETDAHVASSLIVMYCRCLKSSDGHRVFESADEKNIVCWNSMISGYTYVSKMEEAEDLFARMKVKNIVSWNALLSGYDRKECYAKVLDTFNEMLISREIPNEMTFSTVLHACANLPSLEKGKYFHAKISKLGKERGVFVGTALTDMYSKAGDIESARSVFTRMPEKNEVSWTAMIQGLAESGYAQECLVLFEEMQTSGIAPNEAVFLSVLSACSHCGLVDKGFQYFESMSKVHGILPKPKHYTSMVDLLGRAGRLREAEAFIESMQIKDEPNTWAALLSGCSKYKNEEIGEKAAWNLFKISKENPASYILLSNIYASSGRWGDVAKVRMLMRKAGLKKGGGCSWILIRDQCHTFFAWDPLHPKSSDIYSVLELLLTEMTE